jgi:hypothetical protein
MMEIRRGHPELLDGRLCRPDSEQCPWTSNLCAMTIVKSCWHNFTQSAYFMISFVSSISYRPTDLSLLTEFSKNVSFWKFYIFHQIFPNRGLWIGNFTTKTIVKLCCHNFTQSAYFMIFSVSSIFYRPTDLSLLKAFFKNVSFSNSYKLPSQSAVQKISMSMDKLMRNAFTLLNLYGRQV